MENPLVGDIVVPEQFLAGVTILLQRLTHAPLLDEHTSQDHMQKLRQVVDWRDACISTEQLQRALGLLGRREELSPPPKQRGFPIGVMNVPMGTLFPPRADLRRAK